MDYKFGKKNNWRRWAWNQVKSRIDVPVGEAVVLYLAAEQDLDAPVAISKGFKEKNIIAVNYDHDVVESLRSKGRLVIEGNIIDVVAAWPETSKVKPQAVIADFCSPMTDKIKNFAHFAMGNFAREGLVLVVNLMSGRECAGWNKVMSGLNEDLGRSMHRGEAFESMAMINFAMCLGAGITLDDMIDTPELMQRIHLEWRKLTSGKYYSYISDRGMRFDSVAMTFPPNKFRYATREIKQRVWPHDISAHRNTAATLAIRTMKYNT